MKKPIERSGVLPVEVHGRVTAICCGRAPKTTHASVWMIDGQYWGLRALRYGLHHNCLVPSQPRGCATAAHLRAVNALLDALPEDAQVNLQITSPEAEALLRQWLRGDPTLPPWCTGSGSIGRLAERLGKMTPGQVIMEQVSANASPLSTVAYKLADTSRRTCDSLYGGDENALTRLDEEIPVIIAALNA